ncbi:hypothetical protein [Erwinia rhapontici]|uniref:Uncharacterized protein n=1 Tax=Erwinia rhapontici TaxID=55212 RepID=A0ABM7N620_ERWRD|nr:hypothetical protein [Erwinia rhapontici]TDT00839.1 hypothetical protein EDF84_102575 [Erwinia rhapontici]BCQ36913.1 hypothetical protein ERHA53_42560 [Erwinia rhapontici]BCQ41921.1 hypothetical protein ERHA54_45240 [Erwinia rhapontici]BCQ47255.1 hypothetical protein ERHA55_47820 [Erwinia rhapontici]
MEVDLNVLEGAVNKIFSEMRRKGLGSVSLDTDFYWNIPSEMLYDPYTEPTDLNIGQLEEDYENLVQMSNKNMLIGHNLKNIAVLLRYLSEKYPF